MATKLAVAKALGMLSLAFAGDVSAERVDLYVAALDDVTDGQLVAATAALVKRHKGEFIPTPAAIREAAGANAKARVDVETLLRRIDRAGDYNPATGTVAPRVERVRSLFGNAVADAYGAVGGGARLLDATDSLTREIAARDFAKELEAIVDERGPACLALPAPPVKLISERAA